MPYISEMIHHFADLLYREEDYWNMTTNMGRYNQMPEEIGSDLSKITVLTISKFSENWQVVFECPNLVELTIQDATKVQINAIKQLKQLLRLRVSYLRTSNIDFIAALPNIQELVLEYVSGFDDLSALRDLKQLRSLHIENLRGVSRFEGLSGIASLRYLYIGGTLDWNQPIEDFSFLHGLPDLEVFMLGFVINKSPYPALLPLARLKHLKKIHLGRSSFPVQEYALLQAGLPQVNGATKNLFATLGNRIEFIGKRGGWVAPNQPNTEQRCAQFEKEFGQMVMDARNLLQS